MQLFLLEQLALRYEIADLFKGHIIMSVRVGVSVLFLLCTQDVLACRDSTLKALHTQTYTHTHTETHAHTFFCLFLI